MRPERVDVAWSDVNPGRRIVFATPNSIRVGGVLERKGRSLRVQFDGELRSRVIPNARWYFVQGKQGNGVEFLSAIESDGHRYRPKTRGVKVDDEFVPVSVAALSSGVSAKQIRLWLRKERVLGRKSSGGEWLVNSADLERKLAER